MEEYLVDPDLLALAVSLLAVVIIIITAASEIAFASVHRGHVRERAEHGERRARTLENLLSDPVQFLLTTVLLRSSGFLVAGATVALLMPASFGFLQRLLAVLISWLLLALLQILAQAYARGHAARVALHLAPVMNFALHLFWPITALLRRIGTEISEENAENEDESVFLSEEGLRLLINVREEEDSIQESEKQMIASILDMEVKVVREVMVPRIDMATLNVETSLRDALDLIIDVGHSRIPVYEGSADRILGFLYAKDLLRCFKEDRADMPIRELLRPAYFVPISKKLNTLFREMQKRWVHIAIVVDEYGGTAGLITIEDILEEIVGEIQDEYDAEEDVYVQPVGTNTYLLNSRLDIDTLSDLLSVELPEPNADTLGGLIYSLLGHVPDQGESVVCEGWQFTVLALEGRRIDQVRAEPASQPLNGDPSQPDEQEVSGGSLRTKLPDTDLTSS
jgi:CBS domain containing-hemolysin-like protein